MMQADLIRRSWATWGPPGDERSEYRYELGRAWGTEPPVAFIGLNPSTATAELDDPTIRRCIRFTRDLGAGGLVMLNLFAYRSTDPRGLERVADPVGPGNDAAILAAARRAAVVVAAWGTWGELAGRGEAVRQMLAAAGVQLHALRLTKGGHPAHPLYLPAALRPQPWEARHG